MKQKYLLSTDYKDILLSGLTLPAIDVEAYYLNQLNNYQRNNPNFIHRTLVALELIFKIYKKEVYGNKIIDSERVEYNGQKFSKHIGSHYELQPTFIYVDGNAVLAPLKHLDDNCITISNIDITGNQIRHHRKVLIDILYDKKKDICENNAFCSSMPIALIVEHFKILTEKKSKNELPFLTKEQFEQFIRKAISGIKSIPKIKLNMSSESMLIINLFYVFFNQYKLDYNLNKRQCVKLLTDNFYNFEEQKVFGAFHKKPKQTI